MFGVAVVRKKIVLLGWYGYGNLGDEAILVAMIQTFRCVFKDFEIVVISHDPVYTQHSVDVTAIKQYNILSLFKLLLHTRLCILGGGGLIKDGSCLNWLRQILFFKFFGAKTMCYAIGVAPLNRKLDKLLVKLVFNHFIDSVTVRDNCSREFLKKTGVSTEIIVSADPVLRFTSKLGSGKKNIDYKLSQARRPIIGICLKQYAHDDLSHFHSFFDRKEYIRKISSDLDSLLQTTAGTLVMLQSDAADFKDILDVYQAMEHKFGVVIIEEKPEPAEFFRLVSLFDALVSQRLHPLILASLVSIPIIAIPYAAKVRSYMKEVGVPEFCIEYEHIGRGQLTKKVCDLLRERELIRLKLSSSLIPLKARAKIATTLMRELLD